VSGSSRPVELGVTEGKYPAAGADLPTGVDTGIRLIATDARAARAKLVAHGCEVGELLDWDTAPLMFSFQDPDGNRLYVSEAS
jgi:hypothetical protein